MEDWKLPRSLQPSQSQNITPLSYFKEKTHGFHGTSKILNRAICLTTRCPRTAFGCCGSITWTTTAKAYIIHTGDITQHKFHWVAEFHSCAATYISALWGHSVPPFTKNNYHPYSYALSQPWAFSPVILRVWKRLSPFPSPPGKINQSLLGSLFHILLVTWLCTTFYPIMYLLTLPTHVPWMLTRSTDD